MNTNLINLIPGVQMAKDADTYVLPAIMLAMAGFWEGKSALKGRKPRQTPFLGGWDTDTENMYKKAKRLPG